MTSWFVRVISPIKKFIDDYFLTIATVTLCVFLVWNVQQVRYAYWPADFGATMTTSIALALVFLTYFAISTLGILQGRRLYRQRLMRRGPRDGNDDRVKPIYVAMLWLVTWPNMLARRLAGGRRRFCGILLVVSGVALGAAGYFSAVPHGLYPLSELAIINLALVMIALGAWLTVCNPDNWPRPGQDPTASMVLGWRVGWLLTTCLIGEVIWFVATLQLAPPFGYLMYTQWAVLQLLCFMILTAHTIDYLDGKWPIPLRSIGVIAIALLLLTNLRPETVRSTTVSSLAVPTTEAAKLISHLHNTAWIQRLEDRVDHVPEGPCVIVAASGGGTRAALFASLVLRGMEHETSFVDNSGVDHKFSEHLVAISSVSGGSLAAAECVLHRDNRLDEGGLGGAQNLTIRNTDRRELVEFIRRGLTEELKALKHDNIARRLRQLPELRPVWEARVNKVQEQLEALGRLDAGTSNDSWILNDQVVDSVSTDFMAPILRGTLTPGISRGEALRRFWDQLFAWKGISNVSGFPHRGAADKADEPVPLVFFNSCNTTWGSRYTIGFPVLPQPFFSHEHTDAARDPAEAAEHRTRFPVRALSDTLPLHEVSLSHAVRLSSNFPWGFRVRTLAATNLLDGGIVDNTGIDTIYELFRRLHEDQEGRRVMAKMASKGVFILEIDSGGKPSGNRDFRSESAGLLEPLKSMGNAQRNRSR